MGATFDTFKKSSIPTTCFICKGECWKGDDQPATQKAMMDRFGKIESYCVNGSDGSVHCPVALGILK